MNFDTIRRELAAKLNFAQSIPELENLRIQYLGRKGGIIADLTKHINFSVLTPEEKKSIGSRLNEIKSWAEHVISERRSALDSEPSEQNIQFDLTLPGQSRALGHMHPISIVQMELEGILRGLGFRVVTGFEIENEYYNFDALNIPSDHPAREMQDTYWLTNGDLLRTHTSATQVRALKEFGAPLSAIFPGRCFRYETVDASHDNTFYQLEGLMVDQNITVSNLIAVMKALLEEFFNRAVNVRLRPGYFPFVEPGFELDFQCTICNGRGCQTCKNSGWVELIPCGLVHPKVLEHGGIDPDKYSGFAFGCGMTRLAMMKFKVASIRLFNSGDIRFYEQFPAPL